MNAAEPSGVMLNLGRVALFIAVLLTWQVLTATGILPPFFFGTPVKVFYQIWIWVSGGTIWPHLAITLLETLLAFFGGTALGFVSGLWLGLQPTASALLSPYLKAFNAMPRLILAPIFAVWFGLGIWSKVALGISIVFFLVFFNVFHGIREVNPTVLANARMIGANRRQLLRMVYIPSAMTWVFASLHNAVGMAFVGAVIGEYLGSVRGIGYLILEAEGIFDIDAVLAGVIVLTVCAYALDMIVTVLERHLLRWQAH
jgi:NitT/TauT family transport system permease protein